MKTIQKYVFINQVTIRLIIGDDDDDDEEGEEEEEEGEENEGGSGTSAHNALINIPQFILNPPNFHSLSSLASQSQYHNLHSTSSKSKMIHKMTR